MNVQCVVEPGVRSKQGDETPGDRPPKGTPFSLDSLGPDLGLA